MPVSEIQQQPHSILHKIVFIEYYYSLWVFVCGYDAIKEALIQKGSDFAGRPPGLVGSFDDKDPNNFQDGK